MAGRGKEEEGYSVEAQENMEVAVETFKESLIPIGSEEANKNVFATIKVMVNGIRRRIVDLGNVEAPEGPLKIQLMIFNKEHIPLVMEQKIPEELKSKNNKICIIGLVTDPERLADVRRNRVTMMKETNIKEYTDLDSIKEEIDKSKKLFKKYNWPTIDVTRKSVEESAASILKIYEIQKSK